ncbi:MAG: hypothetical protein ACRDQX_01120 [Pseudonocardiaceae bacterium]
MPSDLTHTERVLNGRAGAKQRWSKVPHAQRPERTQAARDGWLAKLADEIDPEHKLDPEERFALAREARSAHMSKIAAQSARARRLRAQGGGDAETTDSPELDAPPPQ